MTDEPDPGAYRADLWTAEIMEAVRHVLDTCCILHRVPEPALQQLEAAVLAAVEAQNREGEDEE